MVKNTVSTLVCLVMVTLFSSTGFAEKITSQLCKKKVLAAAELLKSKGKDAFAELKDPNGPFRFGDGAGYVWVHNLDGIMMMHPIKPALEGKNLLNLRDVNGVYFFVAFNEIAEDKGAGWVPYTWPKPGEKKSSPKVSYVMLVQNDIDEFIVGSGMYDVTAEDIKKHFPEDPVYIE